MIGADDRIEAGVEQWARDNSTVIPSNKLTNAGRDTGTQIRDKLQGLSGNDRLDASAIKNLPTTNPGTGGLQESDIKEYARATGRQIRAGDIEDGVIPDVRSDADIDGRVAPWARANSPTGTIPDNRIPSSIARDSEVPTNTEIDNRARDEINSRVQPWARDTTTDIPDAKVPSTIARTSQVRTDAQIQALARGQITDANIPAGIARDVEIPNLFTGADVKSKLEGLSAGSRLRYEFIDGGPERGARGYTPVRALVETAHGADEPSKPTIASDASFNFQTHIWTGLTDPGGTLTWRYNRSSTYTQAANDIWAGVIFVDENGNVFGGISDLIKIDGETLDAVTGGLSEAEVDARIAALVPAWVRNNGMIPANQIPFATQIQAEGGSNTTTVMNPQRTNQAIAAYLNANPNTRFIEISNTPQNVRTGDLVGYQARYYLARGNRNNETRTTIFPALAGFYTLLSNIPEATTSQTTAGRSSDTYISPIRLAGEFTRKNLDNVRQVPAVTSNTQRQYLNVVSGSTTPSFTVAPNIFTHKIRVHSFIANPTLGIYLDAGWNIPATTSNNTTQLYLMEINVNPAATTTQQQLFYLFPNLQTLRGLGVSSVGTRRGGEAFMSSFGRGFFSGSLQDFEVFFARTSANRLLYTTEPAIPGHTVNIYTFQNVAVS